MTCRQELGHSGRQRGEGMIVEIADGMHVGKSFIDKTGKREVRPFYYDEKYRGEDNGGDWEKFADAVHGVNLRKDVQMKMC